MKEKEKDNHQSRLVHIRTVLPVASVVREIREEFGDDIELAWATHEDKTPHCHIILRFPSVRRWQLLYDWVNANDAHGYVKSAGSWQRSVRYLLHLDNPEKPPVPRSALGSYNVDEDDLSLLLAGRASGLLDAINASLSMAPVDAFSYLVEKRGFKPGECISGVRLLRELESLKSVRQSIRCAAVRPPSMLDEESELDLIADDEIEDSIRRWEEENGI